MRSEVRWGEVKVWLTAVRSTKGPFSRVYNSAVQVRSKQVKAEKGERVQLSNMKLCGSATHPGHEVWEAQVRPHDLLEHGLPVATGGATEKDRRGNERGGKGRVSDKGS
jgi:hypothetical protein